MEEDDNSFDMSQWDTGGQSYAPGSAMSNLGMNQEVYDQSYAPQEYWPEVTQTPNMDVPPNTAWGDQSFAPNSAMSNLMQQSTPSFGMSTPNAEIPDNQGWSISGLSNTLASLFNQKQGQGTGGQQGGLGTILAALASGMQNTQKAGAINGMVQQQQARTDPFASQRPQYQQALASTIQDPYSQPIVKAQTDQIAQAQAIKDAAAGRRSNSATTSPAMLAAQAQIAQQYMNSLMTPAGANINPSSAGLAQLMEGINSSTNGYISPMASALGYNQQTNTNQAQLDALKKFLAGSN